MLGRFVQADTIVPLASQGTQAWDRYAYVNNNPMRFNDPTGHQIDKGEDGGQNSHVSATSPFYDTWEYSAFENSRNKYVEEHPKPLTIAQKAARGDVAAAIDLLIPTNVGARGQIEGSFVIVSVSVGVNIAYNRVSDEAAYSVDLAVEGGPSLLGGASVTGGPLAGWGSSSVNDVTDGVSLTAGGSTAVGPAMAGAISVPLDTTPPSMGLHVDPLYGTIPTTVYLGGGAGGIYAGAGGGPSFTLHRGDLTEALPWHNIR